MRGLLQRAVRRLAGLETRKEVSWDALAGTLPGVSGRIVTPDVASQLSAVHGCVQVIAETVASLPLLVYRRLDGGRERDESHPLDRVLHHAPNPLQSAFEFREQLTANCLYRGNGYARIVTDGNGQVRELWPLANEAVQIVKLPGDRIAYDHQPAEGQKQRLLQGEVLHLRYRSKDGITGLSPITIARESIAAGLAAQEYATRFLENDTRPSGVLKHPGNFKDDDSRRQFRQAWEQAQSGARRFSVMVLEFGMEFQALGLTNEDVQLLETRRFGVEEICRIFRVPPHKVAELSRATFNNIEEQERAFVRDTVRPWLVRWEQAIRRSLLTENGRRTHLVEHSLEGLLRGDTKSRSEAYRTGIQWGWLSPNEVRRLENLNPRDGGDTYLQPLNMEPSGDREEEDDDADD